MTLRSLAEHAHLCRVQVWLGYQQSLRPCQTGLLLNMDVAATAFIEPMDAIPFLAQAARASDVQRMNAMQLRKASHAVRGVQVSASPRFIDHRSESMPGFPLISSITTMERWSPVSLRAQF